MKQLRNRPIDPLQPPADSFDQMLKSARGRRRRQAMAVVSSAAALVLVASGAFALGNTMGRSDNVVTNAVANGGGAPGTASATHPSSASASKPTPHKRHRKHANKQQTVQLPAKQVVPPASTTTVTATTTAKASPKPIIHLRGLVTDPGGHPLAGVYVLPGFPDTAAFAPHNGSFIQTNAQGEFDIACPRSPVYLATWPLNRPITTSHTGATYAPAWFGAPRGSTSSVVPTCGIDRKTTVLRPMGTSVTGRVGLTPESGSCPVGKTFTVGVWLYGNKSRSVRMNGLTLDPTQPLNSFTFLGLPEGTHILNAGGNATTIIVKNGAPVGQDALFTCHGPPVTPTPTPTPTGTPTDSTVPSPATSPSTTPPATP